MGGISGYVDLLRRVKEGDRISAREQNRLVDAVKIALRSISPYHLSDSSGQHARRQPYSVPTVRLAIAGEAIPLGGLIQNQWDYPWKLAEIGVSSNEAEEQSPLTDEGTAADNTLARNLMEQNNTATEVNNGVNIESTKTIDITVGPIPDGTPVVLYTFRKDDHDRVYRIDMPIPINVECVTP